MARRANVDGQHIQPFLAEARDELALGVEPCQQMIVLFRIFAGPGTGGDEITIGQDQDVAEGCLEILYRRDAIDTEIEIHRAIRVEARHVTAIVGVITRHHDLAVRLERDGRRDTERDDTAAGPCGAAKAHVEGAVREHATDERQRWVVHELCTRAHQDQTALGIGDGIQHERLAEWLIQHDATFLAEHRVQ